MTSLSHFVTDAADTQVTKKDMFPFPQRGDIDCHALEKEEKRKRKMETKVELVKDEDKHTKNKIRAKLCVLPGKKQAEINFKKL